MNKFLILTEGRTIIPMRYLMSIMGCIGMAIIYGFKVNVSVAMVAMVNETAIRLLSNDHTNINETLHEIKSSKIVCFLN